MLQLIMNMANEATDMLIEFFDFLTMPYTMWFRGYALENGRDVFVVLNDIFITPLRNIPIIKDVIEWILGQPPINFIISWNAVVLIIFFGIIKWAVDTFN